MVEGGIGWQLVDIKLNKKNKLWCLTSASPVKVGGALTSRETGLIFESRGRVRD